MLAPTILAILYLAALTLPSTAMTTTRALMTLVIPVLDAYILPLYAPALTTLACLFPARPPQVVRLSLKPATTAKMPLDTSPHALL